MALNCSSSAALLALALLLSSLLAANSSGIGSSLCNTCTRPWPVPPSVTPPGGGGRSTCPRDTLELGVCAKVLGVVNATVGSPPTAPCCSLLGGLVDLEAALCLCTAIKANVLGIDIDIPVSLSLLLNVCGKKPPTDFQCY